MFVSFFLSGLMVWGALMSAAPHLRGAGFTASGSDPMLGSMLMLGASLAQLYVSIRILIWLLSAGTRGDNFFGPDPYGGAGGYAAEYMRGQGLGGVAAPGVTTAAPGQTVPGQREDVAAYYRQQVLGKQER